MHSISNLDTINQQRFTSHANVNQFGENINDPIFNKINQRIEEDEGFNTRLILNMYQDLNQIDPERFKDEIQSKHNIAPLTSMMARELHNMDHMQVLS